MSHDRAEQLQGGPSDATAGDPPHGVLPCAGAGEELPAHVTTNRSYWDNMADDWVAAGERCWKAPEPYWGIWLHKESNLKMLPDDMSGMRAIELGCGTGYVSGWMLQRGATEVVGVDNSEKQLETASTFAAEHGVSDRLKLIHGNAECVDEPDASFDFVISEYGAALWCDPYTWIPEAHRLLKSGGRLVFLGNHPLLQVCLADDGEVADKQLHRSYFDLHKLDWTGVTEDPGGVEFGLPFGEWIRLFKECGFEIEELLEPTVPDDAVGTQFCATAAWSKQWPCEYVWKLRKLE